MKINQVKKLIQLSIGQKLLAVVLTIVIVVMSIVAVFRVTATVNVSQNEFQSKIENTSKLATLAFSSPLWNYDEVGVASAAEALLQDPEIVSVTVKALEGVEIYHNTAEEAQVDSDQIQFISSEIFHESHLIGIVTLGVSYDHRQSVLWNDIALTIGGILSAVFILWALLSWAVMRLIAPLSELEAGTEEISNGNFDKRLSIPSEDEIGRLALKFNAMAENLENMMLERDQILEALKRSEEKFGKAFQYSAEIIAIIRVADQQYLEINDMFVESLGYSREDVIGQTSLSFGLWPESKEYEDVYQELQKEGAFRNYEMHWRSKAGKIKIGLCSGALADIGDQRCLIIVWHDITERKMAEAALLEAHNSLELKVEERTSELNAMNQELRAMNEELFDTLEQLKSTQSHLVQSEKLAALGSLVAGVAHEINTPIGITATSYLGKLNMEFEQLYGKNALKRNQLEDYLAHVKESTDMVMLNLERAAKLINSFKQVSVDQSSEQRRVFEVYDYLNELLSSLHPVLKNSRQNVRISCSDTLQIDSYPGAFAQIITNFIMNALLHAFQPDEDGFMDIKIEQQGDLLLLVFEDDGGGMSEEVRERIYDPFFTTKRGPAGGTGLGLHIVYNIVVQKLGGTIVCESEIGKGTRFVIHWPVNIIKS